jgi:hypothetical protein
MLLTCLKVIVASLGGESLPCIIDPRSCLSQAATHVERPDAPQMGVTQPLWPSLTPPLSLAARKA